MLANRVVEWTQEWKREGFERGLTEARTVLVHHLEARFGLLPDSTRSRLEAIDSVAALMEMMGRVPQALSLADLGLC